MELGLSAEGPFDFPGLGKGENLQAVPLYGAARMILTRINNPSTDYLAPSLPTIVLSSHEDAG